MLISDDGDIVPDGVEQRYEHEERSVTAMTFRTMMERFFDRADIDFSEIDGAWLARAYAAMGAGE